MKIRARCDTNLFDIHEIVWIVNFEGYRVHCIRSNGEIIFVPFSSLEVDIDDIEKGAEE